MLVSVIRYPLTCCLLLLCVEAAAAPHPLDSLKPGEWYEVPGSKMSAVVQTPTAPNSWSGATSIIGAWNGGAYDVKRDRLIIWGGGHQDYSGNEIYVFDTASLKWSRINDYSPDVGGSEKSGYYPDGRPRSRHTYNYVVYVPPPADRFCSLGGAALFPSGQISIANVDCFDFKTLKWSRFDDAPSGCYYIGAFSAIDANGRVWSHGGNGNGTFCSFDPQAAKGAQWKSYYKLGWVSYAYTATIDAARQRFVAVGNKATTVWDLGAPAKKPVVLATTGATAIEQVASPGVAYDPKSDRVVAWNTGPNVYTLDPTNVWKLHKPTSMAKVSDLSGLNRAKNGTYGRFRYVPSYNVFIVVNSIDKNVFYYKLAPGGGTPFPDAGSTADSVAAEAGPRDSAASDASSADALLDGSPAVDGPADTSAAADTTAIADAAAGGERATSGDGVGPGKNADDGCSCSAGAGVAPPPLLLLSLLTVGLVLRRRSRAAG